MTDINSISDEEYIRQTFDELDKYFGEDNGEETRGNDEGAPGDPVEQPLENGEPEPDSTPASPQEDTPGETEVLALRERIEQLEKYQQFEEYLNTHPDVRQRVVEAARGQERSVLEPPTPPQPPEYLDLEDPTTKYVYDQIQAIREQQTELSRNLMAQREAQANEQISVALSHIKDKFSLDDAQLNELRDNTAQRGIVPFYMQRHPSPITALEAAFEDTLWTMPQHRDAFIQHQLSERSKVNQQDRTRQQKLGKLSNKSGGSQSPPVRKEPETDEEVREAMIQDISQAMSS